MALPTNAININQICKTYFLKFDITPERRLVPNESNINIQGLKETKIKKLIH